MIALPVLIVFIVLFASVRRFLEALMAASEIGSGRVNVTIALPLQLTENGTKEAARFDA